MKIILTDNAGMEVDIIALYQKLISEWKKNHIDELLESARKHYPGIHSFDELIQKTKGLDIREVPYRIIHLLVGMWQFLLKDTKKRFKPRFAEDFVTPEILAHDAVLRLNEGKGVSWNEIKLRHRSAVETAVKVRLYCDALNSKLKEEVYGQKVVELIFADDQVALNDIEKMLIEKNKTISENIPTNDLKEIVSKTLSNKIVRSRNKAQSLSDFLPDRLNNDIHEVMDALLCSHNSEEAKIFSDAVIGVFRCLPYEFRMDIKDEVEKLSAKKRSAAKEISLEHDSDEFDKGEDGRPQIKLNERLEKLAVDSNEELDNFIWHDVLKEFEEELSKSRHEKLKVFFENLKKNPEATNVDLANSLNIHRNTANQRRKDLKLLFNRIVSK